MSIDSALVKRLNRLFSGPLAGRRHPKAQKIKQYFYNAYKFQQTTWNKTLDRFQKNEYRIFNYLNMEALNDRNRRSRYREFDMMEFMPELSSALDIFADEMCSFTDLSPILNIECQDTNQKQILNTLFYDVLDIRNNLWSWVRKTNKYGDFFLYLHLDPELGVQYHVDLPAEEMLRIEGLDESNPNYVRFKWEARGLTFENFQIAHFRIAANERNFPYGVSVLENSRRIFRQLELLENAIISYRIVRAPERRVFYVDVQNVAPKDVDGYVEKIKTSVRRNQIVDPDSGDVTLRYNPLPVHYMTPIPLLDGRTITIKQLAEEFEKGEVNWVYSMQDDTFEPVPGKVVWCGKNYTATQLVEVTLDNGGVVKTAPEHPFVMRDGTSKMAGELQVGDALMPLYTKKSSQSDGMRVEGYDMVYNPAAERYEFVHRLVAKSALVEEAKNASVNTNWNNNKNLVIHHRDFNKLNNSPENLEWIGSIDHFHYHSALGKELITRYNKSDAHRKSTVENNKKYQKAQKMGADYNGSELHKEHNEIRRDAQNKSWTENYEMRKKAVQEAVSWTVPVACMELGKAIYQGNPQLTREAFIEQFRQDEKIVELIRAANPGAKRDINKLSRTAIEPTLNKMGYAGFSDYKKDALSVVGYKNHKVASVKFINETADVYCMTVQGPNGEEDRHNFGVSDYNTFISSGGKSNTTLVFVNNSTDEDYIIPVRGQQSGTRIETLQGGQYQGGVEDVGYLRSKLFAAIKIPSSYLEDKDSPDSQGSLTQKDVRFARTVCRLQSFIVAELEKIAQIHLVMLGFSGEKLVNFKLSLNNPSMIWDIQEMEFLSRKIEVAEAGKNWLDADFIYRKLFSFSTEEIRNIMAGRETDAKFLRKITMLSTPPEAGGLGGGLDGGLGGGMNGIDLGGGLGGDMGGLGELGGNELGGAAGPEGGAGEAGGDTSLLSAPARAQDNRNDAHRYFKQEDLLARAKKYDPSMNMDSPAKVEPGRGEVHNYDHGSYATELNPGNEAEKNSLEASQFEKAAIIPKENTKNTFGAMSTPLAKAIPSLTEMKQRLENVKSTVISEVSKHYQQQEDRKHGEDVQ